MKSVMLFSSDANMSGATLSMVTLAEELTKKNLKVVIVIPCHGDIEQLLKAKGIKYYCIKQYSWIIHNENKKMLKKIITNTKMLVKILINRLKVNQIRRIIKENNIDLIHINTTHIYMPILAAKKEKIKVIWHIREFLEEDQNNTIFMKKKAYGLMRKADKTIAISKSIYKKYSKLVNSENMVMIYNGVDVEKFYFENKIFQNKEVNIFLPGTIHEGKGQFDLLKAIEILKNKGIKNFKVTFAGYATEENLNIFNEKVNELEISDYAKYIGFSKNVKELMRKSDIICVCSKFEAFGRVTVEAMLSGTLVIGADTAGTAEIIQDNKTGLLYKQGDAVDLANKIEFAINNASHMVRIAKDGQIYAKENFNSNLNTNNIMNVYNELLRD